MRNTRTREIHVQPVNPALEEARAYEEHSLRELRAAGYRITMPRVQGIRALADTNKALSAYAIHEKIIGGGGKIDVVSVYRILSTLQEVGLIHHIGVVDSCSCRMGDGHGKRSEVIVDENSGDVMELKLPSEVVDSIEQQAKQVGFEIATVKVEITGSIQTKSRR